MLSVFSCAIPDFPGFVYSRKIVSTLGGILPAGLSWPRAIPDIPAVSKTTRANTDPAILLIVDLLGRPDSTDFSFLLQKLANCPPVSNFRNPAHPLQGKGRFPMVAIRR